MKDFIKKRYSSIAKGKTKSCCPPNVSCGIGKYIADTTAKIALGYCRRQFSCCSNTSTVSQKIGYAKEELESIPRESDMGLGCGNPVALASVKEGETVVDLGSGGGIDVFLAARKVGAKGKVIGIDMTGAMM